MECLRVGAMPLALEHDTLQPAGALVHLKIERKAPTIWVRSATSVVAHWHRPPEEPGLGISGGGHPAHDAALHHAAKELDLYRRHPRQAVVVIVGQRRALAIAVRGAQAKRRWSKLKDWLIA